MPANHQPGGTTYTSHPSRWSGRDLKILDRLIDAFGPSNPLTRETVPIELYDDLRAACLPSWVALNDLRKHLAEHGRKL
jgi:hypothetical protein